MTPVDNLFMYIQEGFQQLNLLQYLILNKQANILYPSLNFYSNLINYNNALSLQNSLPIDNNININLLNQVQAPLSFQNTQ